MISSVHHRNTTIIIASNSAKPWVSSDSVGPQHRRPVGHTSPKITSQGVEPPTTLTSSIMIQWVHFQTTASQHSLFQEPQHTHNQKVLTVEENVYYLLLRVIAPSLDRQVKTSFPHEICTRPTSSWYNSHWSGIFACFLKDIVCDKYLDRSPLHPPLRRFSSSRPLPLKAGSVSQLDASMGCLIQIFSHPQNALDRHRLEMYQLLVPWATCF